MVGIHVGVAQHVDKVARAETCVSVKNHEVGPTAGDLTPDQLGVSPKERIDTNSAQRVAQRKT